MTKNKEKACSKNPEEVAKEKIYKGVEELKKILIATKARFDDADDKTKKKIIAGVAGSIALIAGAVGISKMRKTYKDKGRE